MCYEDICIKCGIAALHAVLSEPATNTDTIINDIMTNADTISPPPHHRVCHLTARLTYHTPPALALLALLQHLEVIMHPPLYPHSPPMKSEIT